ncbi:MAG: hydantoinase B/oxoprolinase family protein [bacterium]|jgi:N-methylhydantoinase B
MTAKKTRSLDAVEITLYSQMLSAVCEEMSVVLQRSAYSPNIKERRDFSTALFDADGGLAAQGTNIPVHLGSMPASVRAALDRFAFAPGDVVILNDPYSGGTHLPDITVVAPFYLEGKKEKPIAYLANRAHHADVGGMTGGSLPLSRELVQEGLIIPPVKLVRAGETDEAVLDLICANSRTPDERRGDIAAQLASLHRGAERLAAIMESSSADWPAVFAALSDYSHAAVKQLVRGFPADPVSAEDAIELPEGGRAAIRAEISRRRGSLVFDFTETDPQHPGPLNAVRAITESAVLYCIRCLLPPEIPSNAGLMRAICVSTMPGTIVDARPPAAVAGGNVETSQRIVDVVYQAIAKVFPSRIPAPSAGTMTNVTVSGIDPRTGAPFAYYETIGGGHGASPFGDGASARHSHMTNSLNTPVEALEAAYPLLVRRYAVRRGSGGAGKFRGGDGIIREIEFLCDAELSILSQRRESGPPGALGGGSGKPSAIYLIPAGGAPKRALPGCVSVRVRACDRLVIETPGGGGMETA